MAKLLRGRAYIIIIVGVVIVVALIWLIWWNFRSHRVADLPQTTPDSGLTASENISENVPLAVSLARNLEVPWALDFLPDGSIVFTERPGRVRLFDARDGLQAEPLLTIDEVVQRGEGGLLGIAVHPDFASSPFIYVYYTYNRDGNLANQVVRFRKEGLALADKTVIIDGIPAASVHNGGRIKFAPDGCLYVTTGDAGSGELAQDKNSLAGKILRLNDDGTIPQDNPFPGSAVYSYGHRNPQGLAWDAQGRLWATEHGSSAADEINLVVPGSNYGWPVIRGDGRAAGMVSPLIQSGGDTWAPSGLAFLDDSLFFAGLRGQSLYQAVLVQDTAGNERVTLRRHFNGSFGRLRDVVVGPDGLLYIITSNRDGRAVPTAADDQLIRINPGEL